MVSFSVSDPDLGVFWIRIGIKSRSGSRVIKKLLKPNWHANKFKKTYLRADRGLRLIGGVDWYLVRAFSQVQL